MVQKKYLTYFQQKGANVDEKDSYGRTPLNHAISKNQKEIVEKLIFYKATINGTMALHDASRKGFKDILQILLRSEADIDEKDSDGKVHYIQQ